VKVKPTLIEKVRGKDLPPEWAEKAGVQPEEEVQVLIGPARQAAAKAWLQSMDRLGRSRKEGVDRGEVGRIASG
jgi:hypothetical protein